MSRNNGDSRKVASMKQSTTVFVDNLPNQIRKIWVYNLFIRFGKIRDLFIPIKKSKITGRSFGFVRFFRIEDAQMAIEKVRDSWYWGHKLVVNFARFLREEDDQGNQWKHNHQHVLGNQKNHGKLMYGKDGTHKHQNFSNMMRGKEVWRRKGIVESSKQGENRRFAATLNQAPSKQSGKIQVQAYGNGWLLRSAVATIRKLVSPSDLELIFSKEGVQNVHIRPMGGRSVIITFPDVESRDLIFKEKWISIWFEHIKPWNGEHASEERFVWLSCFGMPLHVWSVSNFEKIGSVWGHFIHVDEGTSEEKSFVKGNILIATDIQQMIEGIIEVVVDGTSFNVRVKEDDSFRFISQNQFSVPVLLSMDNVLEGGQDKEDDVSKIENDGSKNADLESQIDGKAVEDNSKGNDQVYSVDNDPVNSKQNLVEGIIDSFSSTSGIGKSVVGNEIVVDSFGEASLDAINDTIPPTNLIKHTVNEVNTNTSLVEVDLNEAHLNGIGLDLIPFEAEKVGTQEEQILEENQSKIQAAIKGVKGKKKRKTINEILGYSKIKQDQKKGGKICVLFRSAVAAAALSASISSNGINNRNKILLNEAQAVWKVNQLYMNYDGDEEEVVSKIAELRAQNTTKAVCHI